MNEIFPNVSTLPLSDTKPGSIINFSRSDGMKLAIVTNHLANGIKSLVLLNPNSNNLPWAVFAESWRVDRPVLHYAANIRFEFGVGPGDVDPIGHKSWEIAGAIVSIEEDLFVRAAPQETFYGSYKLVNIRNGSVYSGNVPNYLWTFLAWKLWIRDPMRGIDQKLAEFQATRA